MKYLSLLAFALILFACGEQTNTTTEARDGDMDMTTTERDNSLADRANDPTTTNPMNDATTPSPEVQQTISAVQSAGGDITALSPNAAVSNIDTWIGKLRGMDGTDSLVGDLESLKTELTSGNIDGGKVSGLLSNLASGTRDVANGNQGLMSLASALDAGASKLGGK